MTAKNKKNSGNKATAPVPAVDVTAPAPGAAVVDIRAGRRTALQQSATPAADSLRLVQAFLKITDPLMRAELIRMAENYVRRARSL